MVEQFRKREEVFRHSQFTFYPEKTGIEINGKWVDLAPNENKVLIILARNPGIVISAKEISQGVWNEDCRIGDVKTYIKELRRKIEPERRVKKDGYRFIVSMSNRGYSLVDPGSSQSLPH